MKQKDIFLESEGNAWFRRNLDAMKAWKPGDDVIVKIISELNITPQSILEVGCSSGHRLNFLKELYGAECFGIDPSKEAIDYAAEAHKELNLNQATADALPFKGDSFDMLISGFCLYLADREDLFRIAMEYDRVLKDGGLLILCDFYSPVPYKNPYIHVDDLYSYKADYSKMFTWNPQYRTVRFLTYDHSGSYIPEDIDDVIGLYIIKKSISDAYRNGCGK